MNSNRHRKATKYHAIGRIAKRLRKKITSEEYFNLCENATKIPTIHKSHEYEFKRMEICGFLCDIVYNPVIRMIVTVRPENIKKS